LSIKQKAPLTEDSLSSEWSVQQQDSAACQHTSHLDLLEPVVKASNIAIKTGEHKKCKCQTSKFPNIKALLAQNTLQPYYSLTVNAVWGKINMF
jgi:hypothetical protein